MYITITPQKLGGTLLTKFSGFCGLSGERKPRSGATRDMEHFFNQYGDEISAEESGKRYRWKHGTKLKKTEPKFYSITVSPSKYELKQIAEQAAKI